MALFCVISADSGTFWEYCVKVRVRYLISWWVLVHIANLLSAVLCNWAEFNAHSAHCCRSDAIRLFQTFYIVVIEAIQKRAIRIIFECTRHMSYANSLYLTELSSLQHRRQQQARDFFRSLLDPNSCLHSMLPTPRDPNLVATLRAARRFLALASRTKKYQSFINFGLLNYQ